MQDDIDKYLYDAETQLMLINAEIETLRTEIKHNKKQLFRDGEEKDKNNKNKYPRKGEHTSG